MKNLVNEAGETLFYIVSVKDELTQTFLQPMFGGNLDEIKRLFFSMLKNTPVWKDNPTDYSLYQIGYFNQESGEITPHLEKITSGYINKMEENS